MKFIFFDCDGVLVDTEAVAARVVTQWFGTFGYNLSEDDFIKTHTGKTFGAIFKELVEQGHLQEEYWKDDTIRSLEETIYESIELVPGIRDCLKTVMPRDVAVISNSRKEMVKKALTKTKLDEFFNLQRIYSSEFVAKPKPDPGVYLNALKELNLKVDNCIAIEDSLTGVKAAVAAGIPTIGFTGASHLQKRHDQQLLEAGAYVVASHALELPDLLKEA